MGGMLLLLVWLTVSQCIAGPSHIPTGASLVAPPCPSVTGRCSGLVHMPQELRLIWLAACTVAGGCLVIMVCLYLVGVSFQVCLVLRPEN